MLGNSNNDYETVARSNESIRDRMDGTLNEPQKVCSTENKPCDGSCGCGGGSCHRSNEDHSMSRG